MEFTPTQQAFIDDLISKKYSEAYSKASAKAESAAVTALKTKLTEAHDKLRVAAIEMAAIEGEAVNPEQVVTLTSPFIKVADDGMHMVVDEHGERRYDKSGAALSVKAFISEFLDANKHMRKSSRPVESGRGFLKSLLTF